MAVSVPAGQLTTPISFTLEKKDITDFDGTGTSTCYRVSPDPSFFPGTAISIPYGDIGGLETGPEMIGAVILDVYDPWIRTYRMIPVEYTPGPDALTVALDQVREETAPVAAALGPGTRIPASAGLLGIGSFVSDTICSVWILIKETWYIQSQSTKEILEVPFYDQGDTPHCWAVATSMAIRR